MSVFDELTRLCLITEVKSKKIHDPYNAMGMSMYLVNKINTNLASMKTKVPQHKWGDLAKKERSPLQAIGILGLWF